MYPRNLIMTMLTLSFLYSGSALAYTGCFSPSPQHPQSDFNLPQFSQFSDRKADPKAKLQTAGLLPNEGIHNESAKAKRDLKIMRDAALIWLTTQNSDALNFARRYLMAWFNVYQPSYRPIDETPFDALIDTYTIIKDQLPPAENQAIRHWLEQWAQGYIDEIKHAPRKNTSVNNWQSHRVKLITLMAVATDNDALFQQARVLFKQQIKDNIFPDGEVLDFKQRDALHYVVYDLQPLVQAALAARTRGEDWYHWQTPQGASVDKAVLWLKPYLQGKSHQEFVHTTAKFDKARAEAGVKGFSGQFAPQKAGELIWFSSVFDPQLTPLAKTLMAKPSGYIQRCVLEGA